MRGSLSLAVLALVGCQPAATSHTPHQPGAPTDVQVLPLSASPPEPAMSEPFDPCGETPARLICPPGTTAKTNDGIVDESGTHRIESWCELGDHAKHGPYANAICNHGRIEEGEFDHGKRTGEFRTRALGCVPTGPGGACKPLDLAIEHYDADGRLDGERRTWSDAGKPTLVESYSHGQHQGKLERWTDAGILAERGQFGAGTKQGLWQTWSSEGELTSEGRYANDKPIGSFSYWAIHPRRLVATEQYDEQGLPDGEFCHWIGPTSRKQCFRMTHGSGALRELDDDGKTLSTTQLTSGKRQGLHEELDEWGALILSEHYEADQLHGLTRRWDKRFCKAPVEEATYSHGSLDGPYLTRECNDKGLLTVVVRGRYCNQKKCGQWTTTRFDSRAKDIQWLGDDEAPTAQQTWDDAGNLVTSWTPATARAARHRHCLESLKQGGCCDPEESPPPGATACVNGPARPR